MVGDQGVKLSGGEKQRVALARALLKNAEILVIDEATSAMDTMTEMLIQEALNETVEGRTTLIIAHRLSTIRRADKIIVLDGGVVVESGTIDELLASKSHFNSLWERPSDRARN